MVSSDMLVFAILAAAIVAGALFTITRRNPVTAVMGLVGTFFALAALYATLSAHFMAVLQVLVYAGAIMVLFIFVVMILNREEVEWVSFKGFITRLLGFVVVAYGILVVFGPIVWAQRHLPVLAGPLEALPADYGTVATVGMSLFTQFVFPFEAISLLLLVAIVGGVTVSRSQKEQEAAVETARYQASVRATIRPEMRIGAGGEPAHGDDHGHDDHGADPAHHAASH